MRLSKSILVLLFIWLSCLTVHCESNPLITVTAQRDGVESQKIENMCENVNSLLSDELESEWEFLILDKQSSSDTVNITVDMMTYRNMNQETKQRVMQITLGVVYDCDASRSTRNKIYGEICKLDEPTTRLVRQLSENVKSDFAAAYSEFKPFSGTVGWVFGMIALLMFIALGIMSVIDIAYINLPIIQLYFSKDDGTKPRFVSPEAWSAVQEAESKAGVEYVSPNIIYIKNKGKQLIMVIVCLLYLTSGQIFELIAKIMDYFREIIPNLG